ncbi:MAG: sulfatase-like hydrolase/transferase, partial [Coriobacteriales bacterium]|nr:sulfatase-like hydrolase/transferase [Coriobacteriales bacterium]
MQVKNDMRLLRLLRLLSRLFKLTKLTKYSKLSKYSKQSKLPKSALLAQMSSATSNTCTLKRKASIFLHPAYIAFLVVVLFLGFPATALAYIDPATTSYIIQIVSGIIISLSVAFGVFLSRIQMFIVTLRARTSALWVKITTKKQSELRQVLRNASHDTADTNLSLPRQRLIAAKCRLAEEERKSEIRRFGYQKQKVVNKQSLVAASKSRATMVPNNITSNNVTSEKITSNNVTSNKITSNNVTSTNMTRRAFLLWDTRRFRFRLLLSFLMSLALPFSFIFFGISDMFVVNRSILPYSYLDVLPQIITITLVVFAILFIIFIVLRGRLLDYFLSAALGILLMLYIQGNFMNTNIGQLTGDSINWDWYLDAALLNMLICSLIMIIPFVLRFLSAKLWQGAIIAVPAILIAMQTIALLTSFSATGFAPVSEPQETYLSSAGIYDVSSKKNIVVFVLDRLDERYVEQMLEETPNFFDNQLDGFTRYTNNMSVHSRTFPSVVNMLTGNDFQFDIPGEDFITKSFASGTFLPTLRDAGYSTKIYIDKGWTYNNASDLANIADNVAMSQKVVKSDSAMMKLTILSFYRYVPQALKPFFWLSSSTFAEDVSYITESDPYVVDDFKFYNGLKNEKLQVNDADAYADGYADDYAGVGTGVNVDIYADANANASTSASVNTNTNDVLASDDRSKNTVVDSSANGGRMPDQAVEKKGSFTFIHLYGPHAPYTLDEDVNIVSSKKTSATIQARASFKIVFEYINQLKKLELYDDAAIIITGDHGYPINGYERYDFEVDFMPLSEVEPVALFYKP